MKVTKRILAFVLCLVMLLGLVPIIKTDEAEAVITKVSSPDTSKAGTYTSAYMVSSLDKDNSMPNGYTGGALIVNGALNSYNGGAPSVPTDKKIKVTLAETETVWDWGCYDYVTRHKTKTLYTDKIDGDFSYVKDPQGMSKKISSYNMINCFGKNQVGETPGESEAAGFDRGGLMTNLTKPNHVGSMSLGMQEKDIGWTYATITIANNPYLKALAESGDLQFYFSGKIGYGRDKECGKEDGDDENKYYVNCQVLVQENGSTVHTYSNPSSKTDEDSYITTGGFVNLSVNSVIKIGVMGNKASGCDTKYPNESIGFADALLMFRKATCPDLTDYVVTTNGDRYTTDGGTAQVLLGEGDTMSLTFNFNQTVRTSLSGLSSPTVGNGATLMALANRKLFSNTEGTGFINQGEDVFMRLSSVVKGDKTVVTTGNDTQRFDAIKSAITSMTFTWRAGVGDYYGNNALPNDGDWAGSAASSNSFCLLDNIVLASFHDLAGNPVTFNGTRVSYSEDGVNPNVLKGSIQVYDQKTTYNANGVPSGTVVYQSNKSVVNPFQYTATDSSGFDMVIDTVKPTYSKTSNAVQPEILTKLVVNKNDSFLVYLNYSEPVKLRQYFRNGTKTGYQAENLEILFTNGMSGKYKSGIGTKQLTFEVTVPDGNAYDLVGKDKYLELDCLRLKYGGMYITLPKEVDAKTGTRVVNAETSPYFLTDYVGNILVEEVGTNKGTLQTHMSWAKLTVDNTAPEVKFTVNENAETFSVTVDVTDNAQFFYDTKKTKKYTGVFHIANASQEEDVKSGIFYYTWIEDSGKKASDAENALDYNLQQAIDLFKADNYKLAKMASLGVSIADELEPYGLSLKVANNNSTISAPNGYKDGNAWYLLVVAADMTWDSARQRIQYSKASWKTYPEDYYDMLMTALGINVTELFKEVETDPDKDTTLDIKNNVFDFPWSTDHGYSHYYYNVSEGVYQKIRQGAYYPALVQDTANAGIQNNSNDTYYKYVYTRQTGNQQPEDWNDSYDEYFINISTTNTPKYQPVAQVTQTPDFTVPDTVQEETTTAPYGYVRLKSKPADWDSKYTNYFTLSDTYTAVTADTVGSFKAGIYYKLSDTITGYTDGTNYYSKLKEAPADWDAIKNDVYKLDKFGNYVLATTPEFSDGTYYRTARHYEAGYVALAKKPADWDRRFTDYYKLSGTSFVTASSTFTANQVYIKYNNLTELTEEPADWETNYSRYFVKNTAHKDENDVAQFDYVSGSTAPKFEAKTYYQLSEIDAYYTKYELMTAETEDELYYPFELKYFTRYATRKNGSYVTVLEALKTKFAEGTYYTLAKTGEAAYEKVTVEPVDWQLNYTQYYTKNDKNEYEAVEEVETGVAVPEFYEGKYYRRKNATYKALTDEPTHWELVYDTYYEQKEFINYELLIKEPKNWNTEFKNYFTKSGNNYVPISNTQAPTFTTKTYYRKTTEVKYVIAADGECAPTFISGQYYTSNKNLLTEKPADWETNYTKYYGMAESTLYPVQGEKCVPTFVAGKYYEQETTATLATKAKGMTEPADWATNYQNYYLRSSAMYHNIDGAAPTFSSVGTVYKIDADTKAITPVETEPQDWATNYSDYVVLTTFEKLASKPASYTRRTYYDEKTNGEYQLVLNQPADWDSTEEEAKNYASYYKVGTGNGVTSVEAEDVFELIATTTDAVTEEILDFDEAGPIFEKDGEDYKRVTTKPADWAKPQTDYYKLKDFSANTYYKAWDDTNKVFEALAKQPDDWVDTYQNYVKITYHKVNTVAPEWKDTYLSATYTQLTKSDNKIVGSDKSKPISWNGSYSEYYTEAGNTDSRLLNYVPKFEDYKYYYMMETGGFAYLTLAEAKTKLPSFEEDWPKIFTQFYLQAPDGVNYYTIPKVPVFDGGSYYEIKTAAVTGGKPKDWETNFDYGYVWQENYVYTKVLDLFTDDAVQYQPNYYYQVLDTKKLLTEQPADWDTYYYYYFYENETPVEKRKTETYTANKYFVMEPVALKSVVDMEAKLDMTKITDKALAAQLTLIAEGEQDTLQFPYLSKTEWIQTYSNYYYKAANKAYYKLDSLNSTDGTYSFSLSGTTAYTAPAKEDIPSFDTSYYRDDLQTAKTVYKASDTFAKLAKTVNMTADRSEKFVDDMLSTKSNIDQIPIIRGYFELATQVLKTDVDIMEKAAQYSAWSSTDFSQDDSNWTINYSRGIKLDLVAPTISMDTEGVTDDNTGEVKIAVKVMDDFSPVKEVEYKFVPVDTTVTKDDKTGWMKLDTTGLDLSSNTWQFTLNVATYMRTYELDDGQYDLYVRASDNPGNQSLQKIASINLCTFSDVYCSVQVPQGMSSPYETLEGSTITISGTAQNMDVSKLTLSVLVAFDQQPTKKYDKDTAEGVKGWGDPVKTSESNVFKLGAITPVNGTYYLHVAYSYDGGKTWNYFNKYYEMKAVITDISINEMGKTKDSVTVEFVPDGKTNLQYQVITDKDEAFTKEDAPTTGWLPLDTMSKTLSGFEKGVKTIRIWVKDENDIAIRSKLISLIASPLDDENAVAPKVNPALMDVYTESGAIYAVVKLTTSKESLNASTEYSMAISDLVTDVSAVTWQRWRPYESIVRIKLGEEGSVDLTKTRLMFKFRSGSDVTAEEDYIIISDFSEPTDEAWVIAVRDTYLDVGATGLGLTFYTKPGSGWYMSDGLTDPETGIGRTVETANGLYTYEYTCTDQASAESGQTRNFYLIVNNVDTTPPAYTVVWQDGGVHTQSTVPVRVNLTFDEEVKITSVQFKASDAQNYTDALKAATYLYQENGTAKFTFEDAMGNENSVELKVTWIDNKKPVITSIVPQYTDGLMSGKETVLSRSVRLYVNTTNAEMVTGGTTTKNQKQLEKDESGFYMDVTANGTYTFMAYDEAGKYVSKSYIVSNISESIAEPTVSKMEVVKSVNDSYIRVTMTGKLDPKIAALTEYKLYNGSAPYEDDKKVIINEITIDRKTGEYSFTRDYYSNGTATAAICDNLGAVTYYDINVIGKDDVEPTVEIPKGKEIINVPVGTTIDKAWWLKNLVISDNAEKAEDLDIKFSFNGGKPVESLTFKNVGAYAITLTVSDSSNNQTSVILTVYVMPTSGLIVMSDKGVLFSSDSTDTALVNERTIRLVIRNFDDMLYWNGKENTTVKNKAATYDVIVRQGLYREGQMKYFETNLKNLTFVDLEKTYGTVYLDVDKLPGVGWYTIIVRTSEREREYTTFFINP